MILTQQVHLEDFKNGWRNITKEFETNIIPHKGDLITDSVWKDPYEQEVIEVNINYQENECYVSVVPIKLKSNNIDHLKNYIEMAKLHKWKCNIDF